MKNQKTNFLIINIILLIFAFTNNGCKKGADDPFLSFRSRNSRLVKNWTLTSSNYTQTIVNTSPASTSTTTKTFNGGVLTIVNASGTTTTESYSLHLDFDKNGSILNMDEIANAVANNMSNYWEWGNDKSNKEQLITHSSVSIMPAGIYYIDKLEGHTVLLTNRELILKQNISTVSGSITTTVISTLTFESD